MNRRSGSKEEKQCDFKRGRDDKRCPALDNGKRADDESGFRRDEKDGSGGRFQHCYSTDAKIFSRRQRKICVDVEIERVGGGRMQKRGGERLGQCVSVVKTESPAGLGFGAFRSGGTSGASGAGAAGASRKRLLGVAWPGSGEKERGRL